MKGERVMLANRSGRGGSETLRLRGFKAFGRSDPCKALQFRPTEFPRQANRAYRFGFFGRTGGRAYPSMSSCPLEGKVGDCQAIRNQVTA